MSPAWHLPTEALASRLCGCAPFFELMSRYREYLSERSEQYLVSADCANAATGSESTRAGNSPFMDAFMSFSFAREWASRIRAKKRAEGRLSAYVTLTRQFFLYS